MSTPEYTVDVLTLDWGSFKQKHPGGYKDKRSFISAKRYYQKKLRKMTMETPHNPEQETELNKLQQLLERSGIDINDIERVTRVNLYQMGYKDEDGNPGTVDMVSAQYIPRVAAEDLESRFLTQAAPVIIKPSKAKPVKRDHKLIFAFGDTQIAYRKIEDEYVPIHDERAMKVSRMICKDLRPETIVNLGDSVDLPQLSRYDADSTHFTGTLQQAFNRAHSYYAELRADNPESKIVEVDSNHNVRLGKMVLKLMPELWGLRQAGESMESFPVLTYPFLANLNAVGVEWVGGYGAAEYRHNDDLVFIHGKEVRSNGSTAELLSKKYPYSNIIAGHGHKAQTHVRTTPDGKYLTAIQAGALCKITGEVPGYGSAVDDMGKPVHKYQDWQQSVLVIEDYGQGRYNFNHVYIQDGKAFYNGKEYTADE